MEIHRSILDVWMKSVLVEQNRTSSIMCHMEAMCQELVVKIFNGFLQGDDVPLRRNVFFDSSFFSASRSWVPIVDAEPSLHCQAIGHISVEAVSCVGWRVFPLWCLAERRIGTLCVDNVDETSSS